MVLAVDHPMKVVAYAAAGLAAAGAGLYGYSRRRERNQRLAPIPTEESSDPGQAGPAPSNHSGPTVYYDEYNMPRLRGLKQIGNHVTFDWIYGTVDDFDHNVSAPINNQDPSMLQFEYAEPIRRIIYTTNAVEGFHRQVRKVTKTKGAFTNDMALLKLVYLSVKNIEKKWTTPLQNWSLSIQ